jgi:hypothetical protein
MTVALKRSSGLASDRWHISVGIYFESNFTRLAYVTDDATFGLTTSFVNKTFTTWTPSAPGLVAGTLYMLVVFCVQTQGEGIAMVAYSVGATNQGHLATSGFTDPYVATTNYTNLFSIFCSYTYTPPGPDYYSPAVKGVGIAHYFAGGIANLTCNWTSVGSYLLNYTLETNNTGHFENVTYGFPASTLTWIANVSITLNSSGQQVLAWRSHANNTYGNSSTPWQYWDIWKPPLGIAESNFGFSSGYGLNGIYYNATGTGGREFIAIAYQNSSFSPWHYEVKAYDLNMSVWTPSVYVSTAGTGQSDGHWAPSISILPNNANLSLVYMQCYQSYLFYSIGTLDLKTETNLTKLISSWSGVMQHNICVSSGEGTPGQYSYPDGLFMDDRLVVIVRRGAASWGNTTMIVYNSTKENNVLSDVEAFNNTYMDWTNVGNSPYLDDIGGTDATENGVYTWAYSGACVSGWFNFSSLGYNDYFIGSTMTPNPMNATMKVMLEVYASRCDSGMYTNVSLNAINNVVLNVTSTGWTSSNITAWVNSTETIQSAKIALTANKGGASIAINITKARLNVTWIGWSQPVDLIQVTPTPGNLSQSGCQYEAMSRNGSKVLLAWVRWNGSSQTENNVHFLYSPDRGETWKNVSGTTMSALPIYDNQTDTKIADAPSRVRASNPVIDENEKVVVPFTRCDAGIYGRHYDWYLRIAQYSTALGSLGTWDINNAVDQNGDMIFGTSTEASFCVNGYYNRPSFWTSGNQSSSNFYSTKYVRFPNNSSKFFGLGTAISGHKSLMQNNYVVRDSLMSYEQSGMELWLDVCGVFPGATQTGAYVGTESQVSNTTFWGSNFTCIATGTITRLSICGNTSVANSWWRAAIYFASNNSLLVNSTSNYALTTGTTGNGWLLDASIDPTVLYAGTNYLLCFAMNITNTFSYRFDNSTVINQTFVYPTTVFPPTTAAFPDTLNEGSKTNYNRTISLNAVSSFIMVKGMGCEIVLADFAVNTTDVGQVCNFTVTGSTANGLIYTEFRTNNTGHWINGTAPAGSSRHNWTLNYDQLILINFTEPLNTTQQVIFAEIWAEDSTQRWRMVNYSFSTTGSSLNIGWNNFTAWTLDVGYTLAQVNASLTYDGINYGVLVCEYANGTRYELIFGWGGDETVPVTADSKLYLLVNVADEWWHAYG